MYIHTSQMYAHVTYTRDIDIQGQGTAFPKPTSTNISAVNQPSQFVIFVPRFHTFSISTKNKLLTIWDKYFYRWTSGIMYFGDMGNFFFTVGYICIYRLAVKLHTIFRPVSNERCDYSTQQTLLNNSNITHIWCLCLESFLFRIHIGTMHMFIVDLKVRIVCHIWNDEWTRNWLIYCIIIREKSDVRVFFMIMTFITQFCEYCGWISKYCVNCTFLFVNNCEFCEFCVKLNIDYFICI